jgi:hypothetical protein
MIRPLFLFLFSFSAIAQADLNLEKLEMMIRNGVLTVESGKEEKTRLKQSSKKSIEQRSMAQRGLASVNPALKPLEIKHFKARPLILFLD